ncbi:hypothetical protein M885DRAFT_156839 [Pelagophyceae sp. CCMP2097]|nr:hypothetical protein M885DRAFT_156839 [Pelagophyceae sp. CCMP2097]
MTDLSTATILRIESRQRADDGDDFGTLIVVGDEVQAQTVSRRPLVALSNETDVLVVAWQCVDDYGTEPTQRWAVGPRSAAAFGWCRPRLARRVACVALANRSTDDAKQLVERHFSTLRAVAAIVDVAAVGSRATLPLVVAGAGGALEVLEEAWGVEAAVDARQGGAVVRFAWWDLVLDSCCLSSKGHEHASYESAAQRVAEDATAADDATAWQCEVTGRFSAVNVNFILGGSAPDHAPEHDRPPAPRHEALRLSLRGFEVACTHASDAAGLRRASTCDASLGDASLQSYARGAILNAVLDRDHRGASPFAQAPLAHFSVARQTDGASEVWRYAGAAIAPLSLSLDRPTLLALCGAADEVWACADGQKTHPESVVSRWTSGVRRVAGRAVATGADLDQLFAKLCAEPRVYFDTIELAPLELRLTLALSGLRDDALGRAVARSLATPQQPFARRRYADAPTSRQSQFTAALLEVAAPLAALSDASFSIGRFAARHALLTRAQLTAALAAHARSEILRHALLGNAFGMDIHLATDDPASFLTGFTAFPTGIVETATATIGDRLVVAAAPDGGLPPGARRRGRRVRRRAAVSAGGCAAVDARARHLRRAAGCRGQARCRPRRRRLRHRAQRRANSGGAATALWRPRRAAAAAARRRGCHRRQCRRPAAAKSARGTARRRRFPQASRAVLGARRRRAGAGAARTRRPREKRRAEPRPFADLV